MRERPRPFNKRRHKNYAKTLAKQLIVCMILVILAILIKKMDIAIVNEAIETIKLQVAKDYTGEQLVAKITGTASKVKEVPAFIASSFQAGEDKMTFSPPTDEAAVVSTFGEKMTYFGGENNGFSRGMTFSSDKEMQVHSIGSGTVTDIKTSSLYGQYVKVQHEDGVMSLYGGLTDIYVKPLDKVKKGQIIAAIAPGEDQLLKFELWADNKIVNPADYIKF